MSTGPACGVLIVVGSLSEPSNLRSLSHHCAQRLRDLACGVDLLDLRTDPLPMLEPAASDARPGLPLLRERVLAADVLLLATPDYHGCMSGALKNFLDHFWREYAGRLFVPVVASYDKGLTVADQIRTVARQCYAWSLPYALTFEDQKDMKDGVIVGEAFSQRVEMMVRDIAVYGRLLAAQRAADLKGSEPGFLARYRPAAARP